MPKAEEVKPAEGAAPVEPTPTPTPVEAIPAWAQTLIDANAAMQQTIADQAKQIDMFKQFAGSNKVKAFEEAQKDHTQKFVHFKKHPNGQLIIGWGQLDRAIFNPKAGDSRGENLTIHVELFDGTKEMLNYSDFTNINDIVKAKLVQLGAELSIIEFESGEQRNIATKFLNA